MNKDNCDFIKTKLSELSDAVAKKDNEAVHGIYDEIMRHLAWKNEAILVQEIDKMVEGINFWYA